MSLWKTSLFLLLGIALEVSAGKWKKEADFNSPKITQLIRQGFTLSCKDCSTLQYVLSPATMATEITCPEGQVCGPADGAFTCIAADGPEASECSCGGAENAFIQDPYDPMQYYACLPGGEQIAQACATGEFFTGDHNDPCATTPKCVTGNIGFNRYDDSCTGYFFCDDNEVTIPTIENCEAGTVWDDINLGCVDPCSLAPADFTCDGNEDGAYVDTINCQIFHLCLGGTQITQQCADNAPFFNEANMCVAANPGTCPEIDRCYECSDTPPETTISTTELDTTTTISTTETDTTTPTLPTHITTTTTTASTTDTSESSATSTTTEITVTASSESTADSTESPTTTGLPPDCDQVTSTTYFPHDETCNKFYSCESDDNGGFEQKEYSCPGPLVFDPVNQYCNELKNVPSCQ